MDSKNSLPGLSDQERRKIAIIGGGPAGLFMYKRLIESGAKDISIHIFERKKMTGAGMPYSTEGANDEHITNVSDNEIPPLVTTVEEWMENLPDHFLKKYHISREHFSEYKVLPRLFFGEYLAAQFKLLMLEADLSGFHTVLHEETEVKDILDADEDNRVEVYTENEKFIFDKVIISTGHHWPRKHEGKVNGYFDSPYPPVKLRKRFDHPVAIKGSSLTAIDALRTLARQHGEFIKTDDKRLKYIPHDENSLFRIVMHSRSGLLPALRFHLDDSHLSPRSLLSAEEIREHISQNEGYLSLDFIFEKDFKQLIAEKDPRFFEQISKMTIEEFVEKMMSDREDRDPFILLKAEYEEAERSIKRKKSVFWKEMLAVLSFAMNYPAKYLSAEDMMRLQKTLMPLISIVIAFIPQSSCLEMLALHEAGKLELIAVGENSNISVSEEGRIFYEYKENDKIKKTAYQTFIDCVGQPHLHITDLPFPGLIENKTIKPAQLKFRNADAALPEIQKGNPHVVQTAEGDYLLNVSGAAINDHFQLTDRYGTVNTRIYLMAVPYIGGYNPDYSGLDFCAEASMKIATAIFNTGTGN